MPIGVIGLGGPSHALALTSVPGVTEVGALPYHRVPPGGHQYYGPVGLPLASVGFHHWLIPAVFADKAGQTGPSCPEQSLAYVPLPIPRGSPTKGMSGRQLGRVLPSPWHERLGLPVVNMTRLQDSCLVALRPARLLPPKRLLTPRSARHLSATDRGLLPGFPAFTRTGLPPAGMVQFAGRTMRQFSVGASSNMFLERAA